MKIESRGYEGKINPHAVTIIAAVLFVAGLAAIAVYLISPQAQANSLISKAGTSIDEADYDSAITDLKNAYALDPENAEANGIINSYLMLILDKAEETKIPEKKKWIASFVRTFRSDDPYYSKTLDRAKKLIDEADKKISSAPYVEKAEALFDKGEYNSAAKEYENALDKGALREDIAPKYDLNCAYLDIRALAGAGDRTGVVDYMNSVSFDCVKDKLGEHRTIDISNERHIVISKRKDDYLIIYGTFDKENDGCAAGMMSCDDINAVYEGEWIYGVPEGYGKLIRWNKDETADKAEILSGRLEKGYFTGDITYFAPDVPQTTIPPVEEEAEQTGDEESDPEKKYLAGVPIFGEDLKGSDLHDRALSLPDDDGQDEASYAYPPMDVYDAEIWPVKDTPFEFEGEDLKAGTLAAGTPARIIAENDARFYVRAGDKKGFVAKTDCLINLPDVMQKEMLYDITNSYGSIYRINEKSIIGVTGESLYPYVKQEDGRYLVPLLYPAAKRLYEAEDQAVIKGYTLKVYDAYQPEPVTKMIYSDTNDYLKDHEELNSFITEDGHRLKDFMPEGDSPLNYGTALDLTLTDIKTGGELKMQSPMHEMSPLSLTDNNTPDADILRQLMEEYGFSGTDDIWWQFELKDARQKSASFQVMPYSESQWR